MYRGKLNKINLLKSLFSEVFFKNTPDGVKKIVTAPAETCIICGDYSYKCSYIFFEENIVVDVDYNCCEGAEIKCSTPHLNAVIKAFKKYYKGVR